MPTGYTSKVHDGAITTLGDYAMECARAFVMGDVPAGTPIPYEFKASEYHQEALGEAQAKVIKLWKMTADELHAEALEAFSAAIKVWLAQKAEYLLVELRYKTMLKYVNCWEPPTKRHVELKRFMLQQLDVSIDGDCNFREADFPKPEPMDGYTWFSREYKAACADIAYHQHELNKSIANAKSKTSFVHDLRAALGLPVSCPGIEIEPGVTSGCDASAGDCPTCGG